MWIRLGVRFFRCLNSHWIDFRHDNCKFGLFNRNCSSLPTVGLLLAHECNRKGVAATSSLVWRAGARDSLSIPADQDHTICATYARSAPYLRNIPVTLTKMLQRRFCSPARLLHQCTLSFFSSSQRDLLSRYSPHSPHNDVINLGSDEFGHPRNGSVNQPYSIAWFQHIEELCTERFSLQYLHSVRC
jgi:hypothetical protein